MGLVLLIGRRPVDLREPATALAAARSQSSPAEQAPVGARPGTCEAADQRLMLTSSSSTWSEVVMTRELAWKPRWARIRLVNSAARSTLDISSVPPIRSPRLPWPATPSSGVPELAVARKAVSPTCSRPAGLVKSATATIADVALHVVGEGAAQDAVAADGVRRHLDARGQAWPTSASRLMSIERAAGVARGVALDLLAAGGDQVAALVPGEGAGAGVDALGARAEDEHAVALDHQVGGAAGDLGGALGEVAAGGGDLDAEADLDRVGAAVGRRRPRRRRA